MTAPRVIPLGNDVMDLNVCPDSLTEFLYRFWIENEIFLALQGNRPLPGNHFPTQHAYPPCQQPITTLICAPQPMIAETSATEQNTSSKASNTLCDCWRGYGQGHSKRAANWRAQGWKPRRAEP
jgi:hypothetical protein